MPRSQSMESNFIQSALTQRLYARYIDTGQILPNQLVTPSGSTMAMYSDLGEKPLFSNRSNSVLRRVGSESQLKQEQTNQSHQNGGRQSRIRVLLPKIASKRDLRISVSPLPTLPFPRVFGKDVISPFKGGASSTMQVRSLQQTQQTLSPLKHVMFEQLETPTEMRSQVQRLRQSRIAPSEKTLAILQMHQKRTVNNPFNQTQAAQVQQALPAVTNVTMDQISSANSTVSVMKTPRIKIRENRVNSTPPAVDRSIIQSEKKERKKKIEVREFMKAKGLNPTPIEFYKLVKNQQELQEFFCYCNRRQDYYDFEVVPFNDKNENEYLTVSKRGLVHFIKGSPNFISVEDWEKEANIYRKIRKIKFFNHFKSWKTFSNWKTLMRRTMFNKTSVFLKRELFLLNSELSKPLLDMKMKTYLIQKIPMVTMQTDAPSSIMEFEHCQEKHRQIVGSNLTKIETDISTMLNEACNASIRTFKEENRIAISDEFFGDDMDNEDKEAFLVGDETHKQMPFTQEATMRTHYYKLSKYIRLTDLIVLDARLKLIKNSLSHVLDTVGLDFSQGRKHKIEDRIQVCALYEIRINFEDKELLFNPQIQTLQSTILTQMQLGIGTVKAYKPFLRQSSYERYSSVIEPTELFNEPNDLLTLAIGNNELKDELSQVSESLSESFGELLSHVSYYSHFIKVYYKTRSFDVSESKNMDQEAISSKLYKLKSQLEQIEKMDVKSTIRIYKIEGEAMKQKIKDNQQECLTSLRTFVPKIQFDRFQEIYVGMNKDYLKISTRPRKIDDYVALISHLRDLTERMDSYSTNFHDTERIGLLMEEHRIKFPERNRNKLKETQTLLIDTKRAMIEAFESSQQNKLMFKKELVEVEIPQMKLKIDQLRNQLVEEGLFDSEHTEIDVVVKRLDTIGEQVKKAKERGKQLNSFQKFLDIEETAFEQANEVYDDWHMKNKLWYGSKIWAELSKNWLGTRLVDVNVDEIATKVEQFSKMANSCALTLKSNKMASVFKEKVDSLRITMPIVTYLRNQALQERHWTEIFEIIGMKLSLDDSDFTLSSLIDLNVQAHKEKLEEISMKASQEQELDLAIEKLQIDWKRAVFDTKQHKESYFILVPTEALNALLEESLVQLSKMLSARFVDRVKTETEVLFKKLQYLENLLDEWLTFQRTWIYLENIFNSADIAAKMGTDAKRFFQIDHIWKEIMKQTNGNPLVSRAIAGYTQIFNEGVNILLLTSTQLNYLEIFRENNRVLSEIQKSLEVLLDKKRTEFPRFYFVSNDELLQILAKGSKDPLSIQHHLRKLFESISAVSLDVDDIVKIQSFEGEEIKIKRVKAQNFPVERWLNSLNDSVMHSVRRQLKETHMKYREDNEDFKRHQWVMDDHTAQSICLVTSVIWCGVTEQLIKMETDDETLENLHWWLSENIIQLSELTKIIQRSDISIVKRKCLVSLITQDVHNRDIVDQLLKEALQGGVTIQDFIWQQQLRYYYLNDEIVIKQVQVTLEYGYEYMGATSRVVITPLTDRCWLTITCALHLKLGAAPSGPAGTGKTESTKDLAKALGKFCVVFNCSDQVNYKMMEHLFLGLSLTGSWACLDEFNRINIEVLSVIAQQLLSIRSALLTGRTTDIYLGEKKIDKFVRSLGVFVTMNPGYKGRTELPDNLKILFRPVSMMIPDYSLIAEVMLFSEGFQKGKELSRKMTRLYKLSSEQLSQQTHYDFGMRAVKSVLVMAGQVKRANPAMDEDTILIKAVKDSNAPKFLDKDLPLFHAIVADLFPNTTNLVKEDTDFVSAIQRIMEPSGLSYNEKQGVKISQLYETIKARFGIMLIGSALTGKSTIIKTLKQVLNYLQEKGVTERGALSDVLNPKSISLSELYGSFNHTTQEWRDGLCSSIIRKQVESDSKSMKWLIFDGPVDSVWVENLNTVLDDNMTLCLSNGERIKLKEEMKMLFEIEDLYQASPATVSRCGMVYTCEQNLNWRPIVQTWLKNNSELIRLSQANVDSLWNLFESHIDNTIELMANKSYKEAIPMGTNNHVRSMCNLIQAIFSHDIDISAFEKERQRKVLQKVFVYALSWSFGGSIDSHHHSSFEVYLGNHFNDLPTASIFDTYLQLKGTNTLDKMVDFQLWTKSPEFMHTEESKAVSYGVMVNTKDTTRYSWLLKSQLLCGTPTFITGATGVGKSLIINQVMSRLKKDMKFDVISLAFSSQTQSYPTQLAIEDKLEKKRKTLLGGHNGSRVIIFIDDVNMPTYDNHGSQPPIELLRQMLDYQGMYDREGLYWKNVIDCTFVCAGARPEGGRKVLSSRYTSHFHMLNVPVTQEDSLYVIFGSYITAHLSSNNGFRKEICQLAQCIVESTVQLHFNILQQLKPSPSKQHYSFNLRDIARSIQSLCMMKSSTSLTVDTVVRLWAHEQIRVYLDKLVTQQDRITLKNLIISTLNGQMRYNISFQDLFEKQSLVFSDFMTKGMPFDDRTYVYVPDQAKLTQQIQEYLEEYNIQNANNIMDLVVLEHLVDHVTRMCRILRLKNSHALLVGISGYGKQTSVRLGAFISACKLGQVSAKAKLTVSEFRESFKNMLHQSGVKGARSVFMITENQLQQASCGIEESILEDVNYFLSIGEIPNMWSSDEKDQISKMLRNEGADKGIHENLVDTLFKEKVKSNLHVVLIMSPIGDKFTKRLRMFPSLMNECQISWFDQWPGQALIQIGTKYFITDSEVQNLNPNLPALSVKLHQMVEQSCQEYYQQYNRRVYTTPSIYLDFLRQFRHLLEKKTTKISSRRRLLVIGREKLRKANETVQRLSQNMIEMQPLLEQSIIDTETLSKRLDRDRVEATRSRMKVEEEKRIVDKQTAEVEYQYNQALSELNKVLPALQDAEDALNTLNQSDISELRGTKFPSKGISNTMIVTVMLLEKRTDFRKIDWKMCQQMMSVGFFEKLKSFDKDELIRSDKLTRSIQSFIAENLDFTPENVRNSSRACYSLCKWCFALLNYSDIAKQVQPKQLLVEQMEVQLNQAQLELAEKQTKLEVEMKRVNDLEQQYIDIRKKRESIQNKIQLCKARVEMSQKLTSGIGGESERWKGCIDQLDEDSKYVVPEIFIAASSLTYFGPFNQAIRQKLLTFLQKELKQHDLDFKRISVEEIISDDIEVQNWKLFGLPSDSVSLANAAIVTQSLKRSYMIDPQGQATNWIQNMYQARNKGKDLKVTRVGAKEFPQIMDVSIKTGKSVLIEDMGSYLDHALIPLIMVQAFRSQHGRLQIQFGGSLIDYDPKFKLYLACSDPNPALLPEVYMKLAVINFTVTGDGLQEQLLADIVRIQNEELESMRIDLTRAIVNDQARIMKIQDEILNLLVNSSEHTILDDGELIAYLEKSKAVSEDILMSITDNQKAHVEIQQQRVVYEHLAERGSIIYFTIVDLQNIEYMYQNSLDKFKSKFLAIVKGCSQYPGDQIESMMKETTLQIFKEVSRGLFNTHKILFAFTLATRIGFNERNITTEEFNLFLKGEGAFKEDQPNPMPKILSVQKWAMIQTLDESHQFFSGIVKSFQGQTAMWKKWMLQGDLNYLPDIWEIKLSHFQKLLLVKCIRPQNLVQQIRKFVKDELGNDFLEHGSSDFDEVYLDSNSKQPVILILSQGVDITKSFLELYKKYKGTTEEQDELIIISLGQGQDKFAIQAIEKAQKRGSWVMLQNCHLYESFMPALEKQIRIIREKSYDISQEFRLFLTTLPCNYFSVQILQHGQKITYEQTKGVKANLLRSINLLPLESYDSVSYASYSSRMKLLQYSLCLFHSVIQERRKYGPLGWNIMYEFNDWDLLTAQDVMKDMLEEEIVNGSEYVRWDSVRSIIGDIIYGGRVTDESDRKTLLTILHTFLNEDVLSPGYSFASKDSPYRPPIMEGSVIGHLDLLYQAQQLPDIDMTEIFGMHESANIAAQLRESNSALDVIIRIQSRQASLGSNVTKSEEEKQVETKAEELLETLPATITREGANRELFLLGKDGMVPPMTIFLMHEVERFNNLISKIRSTLDTLKKAASGLEIMNEDIEQIFSSVLQNKVPTSWADASYPSLKPLASWFCNLKERIDFIHYWLTKGRPGAYWLSAFFFPQGFFTSVLQNYSRKSKVSIDSLGFVTNISSITVPIQLSQLDFDRPASEGVLIYGLFTQSGYINTLTRQLEDVPSEVKQIYIECPMILFKTYADDSKPNLSATRIYQCPVYKTSERAGTLSTTGHSTNFIISVALQSEKESKYWILRGTALLSQTDD